MERQFLVYWKPEQISKVLEEGRLIKAGSNQFKDINPGDTLWICGNNTNNNLVTVGYILVDEIIGQDEANRRSPALKWQADFHAYASPGKEISTREKALAPILDKLRFVSTVNPYLDGQKPLGNQLQRKRELTQEASKMLMDFWNSSDDKEREEYLPTKENFESAYRALTCPGKSISFDAVLDQIETNAKEKGLSLMNDWRMITEKNIIMWSKKG